MHKSDLNSKRFIGTSLAVLSLSLYIIMLFTYTVFITTILLLGLIIVLPLIFIGLIRKDKNIIIRRVKASCWALGFLILILFPTFWLIPQQIYVRTHRQAELITPNAPAVEDFASEFLDEYSDFNSLTFKEKALAVSNFTTENIVWRLDFETYGMSGHVATPTECINRGTDDCQGQAVTMASLLLNLDFKYVWVVETPFHWYVLVRDPDKGALKQGWEKNVEVYQNSGEILTLNRNGGGSMPDWRLEEVVLIFNDKETLYPVGLLKAILIGWTGTAFFYGDIFPMFMTYEVIFLILGMFALAIPLAAWTYYMSPLDDSRRKEDRKQAGKKLFQRVIILGPLLFLVFLAWFFLQPIIWDYTLILAISEIGLLSVLASEAKFWKLIKVEKNN